MEDLIKRAASDLLGSGYAIALTGAGVSTESGVRDFRGPQGIWTTDKDAEAKAYESYDLFLKDPRAYWEEMIGALNTAIPKGRCDINDPYEILENIQKRLELLEEERKLSREIRQERLLNTYKEYLKPGRVFLHKNKGTYVVFHTYVEDGRLICAAHNIQKVVRTRRRKIRLRKVPMDKMKKRWAN